MEKLSIEGRGEDLEQIGAGNNSTSKKLSTKHKPGRQILDALASEDPYASCKPTIALLPAQAGDTNQVNQLRFSAYAHRPEASWPLSLMFFHSNAASVLLLQAQPAFTALNLATPELLLRRLATTAPPPM
ncbi:hypothetical protein DY000_02014086 [Brassica cretica]|uniref:Uncharacterized protein n=1 Tax=Brassica cretica TaxID=69181 RepID=A0ABQ7CXB2_BRACR|nr:hypothetical protein DY000_02014086 [Brassica cretica]